MQHIYSCDLMCLFTYLHLLSLSLSLSSAVAICHMPRMHVALLTVCGCLSSDRVETGGKSARSSHGESSNSLGTGRSSVWADVEGDSSSDDKQTEMQSLHHDPEFAALQTQRDRDGEREGGVEEHQAVEDEVTCILDAHYQENPTLEYLFSKLKTKVNSVDNKKEKLEEEEEGTGEAAVGMRDSGGSKETGVNSNTTQSKDSAADDKEDNRNSSSNSNSDTDTNGADDTAVSSEETRGLLCVSLLNEVIFAVTAASATASSTTATATGGGGAEEAPAASTAAKRRVHCLCVVGFSLESGR